MRSWASCDSPGAAGFHRLTTGFPPQGGAGPDNPLPQGPIGGPGGRDPGSPLWGAKKDIMVWGIFGGRREVSGVVESIESSDELHQHRRHHVHEYQHQDAGGE